MNNYILNDGTVLPLDQDPFDDIQQYSDYDESIKRFFYLIYLDKRCVSTMREMVKCTPDTTFLRVRFEENPLQIIELAKQQPLSNGKPTDRKKWWER